MDTPHTHEQPGRERAFPRLQVLGVVDAHVVPLNLGLTLIELSQGGFSVRSATSFPPGVRHHFRFRTKPDQELTIEAVSVHCRLTRVDAACQVEYVSGFEFAGSERNEEAVAVLIDSLFPAFSPQ